MISQLQQTLLNLAGLCPLIAFWLFVLSGAIKRWKNVMVATATVVMAIGFVCVSGSLIMRGVESGRFPLSNLYESILWFVLAITGGFLYIAAVYRRADLGWLAALISGSMFLYGSWLPSGQHEIKPLMPALVSYWRQIHVPPLICSYALFFLAGAAGLAQLYKSGHFRSMWILIVAFVAACLAIALGTYTETQTWILQVVYAGPGVLGVWLAWNQLKYGTPKVSGMPKLAEPQDSAQTAELYDEISSRCISIGFPLLTFGVITGGLWANHAWGSFWSWDPKESMALTTWLGYAAYIHLRIHHELAAEKLSVVAVAGVLLTLLTYLGFNSLGFGGLHSYGRFK